MQGFREAEVASMETYRSSALLTGVVGEGLVGLEGCRSFVEVEPAVVHWTTMKAVQKAL